MSPKQQRGEATADKLLTTALTVYAERGRQGFTVHAVTRASGVSQGSLYHHFGNFEGLEAALYIRCLGSLLDTMGAALAPTRTFRTGIRALVRSCLHWLLTSPEMGHVLHNSAGAGYLTAHAEQIKQAKTEKLLPIGLWLLPRIESGEIRNVPLPLIEAMVMGPLNEIAHRTLSPTYDDLDFDEVERLLPDLIWHSLRADRASEKPST